MAALSMWCFSDEGIQFKNVTFAYKGVVAKWQCGSSLVIFV